MYHNPQANRKHKILFWLILGAYSTFFAEVFAGSNMFPFFDFLGILIVWPLYGLHTIILTTIIFRYGKPNLSTLVFMGMLFGLYEAYMTKVLWNPEWGAVVKVGDVAVFEVFALVFWWHTWFSFITPLIISERLLTSSQYVIDGLTDKLRGFFSDWKGFLVLVIFGGIFQSVNSPSVERSLLSGVSSVGFLVLLTWFWKRVTRGYSYELPELLPNKNELSVLSIWLGVLYIAEGTLLFPERLPGLTGQSIIWVFYLVLIALSVRAINVSTQEIQVKRESSSISQKHWFLIWLVFIVVLVAAKAFLADFSAIIVFGSWLLGSVFSVVMFFKAIQSIYKKSLPE